MSTNSGVANFALAKMREHISFVHKAYPAECISPNLMTIEGIEEFPGFGGTGFFARRGNEVFYITARHILTASPNPQKWASSIPELHSIHDVKSWKDICDYLGIEVAGDSGRRKLEVWVKNIRPNWPAVPEV